MWRPDESERLRRELVEGRLVRITDLQTDPEYAFAEARRSADFALPQRLQAYLTSSSPSRTPSKPATNRTPSNPANRRAGSNLSLASRPRLPVPRARARAR